MTEIKPWYERISAAWPKTDPEYWPDDLILKYCKLENEELRAALAKVEQGKPVAWQYRMRPDWEDRWQGWVDCSKEAYRNMAKAPLIHDWHYEVRELFTHPARPLTDAQIQDAFEKVASLHAIPVNGGSVVLSTLVGVDQAKEFARAIEAHIKGATE